MSKVELNVDIFPVGCKAWHVGNGPGLVEVMVESIGIQLCEVGKAAQVRYTVRTIETIPGQVLYNVTDSSLFADQATAVRSLRKTAATARSQGELNHVTQAMGTPGPVSDQVGWLTGHGGISIAALCDIIDMPRAEVVAWNAGVVAPQWVTQRLSALCSLFEGEASDCLRVYERNWRQELPWGGCLRELLLCPSLDSLAIHRALDHMRPDAMTLVHLRRRRTYTQRTDYGAGIHSDQGIPKHIDS